MSKSDSKPFNQCRNKVNLTESLKGSLRPVSILFGVLFLCLYAEVLWSANYEDIVTFFTLSEKSFSSTLNIILLNVFLLTVFMVAWFRNVNVSDSKAWKVMVTILVILYMFLMFIYCNSYWQYDQMSPFQSHLTAIIWSPVIVLVSLCAFALWLSYEKRAFGS